MFRAMFSPSSEELDNLGEHYQILKIQSSAPGDGLKHRPKHVELTWNNKLIYIVHIVGYFHSYRTIYLGGNPCVISSKRTTQWHPFSTD